MYAIRSYYASTSAYDVRRRKARREFLRAALACGIGVATVAALGYAPVHYRWHPRLRPPGAQPENDFLASCIKCGQCVQVCPVEAITLADMSYNFV